MKSFAIRASSIKQLLKVLIVLVAAAALIVGGLMWFRYIQSNQSSAPIENVREDLYNAGIELIARTPRRSPSPPC